jgi:hypothetical protein
VVSLEIYQGEDWTADIIWSDQFGVGIPVTHPCRMDIKAPDGTTLVTLETDPEIEAPDIPSINFSGDIGLLQLHLTKTVTGLFPPGQYSFDLFVTTDTAAEYGGSQVIPVIAGPVTVHKRVTVL